MPRPRTDPATVQHGTGAGFRWHEHYEVPYCDPCREVKNKVNRDNRTKRRKREREEAPRKAAWMRACSKLAEKYPAEFREILVEEMRGAVEVPPEDYEQGESNEM